MNIKITTQEQRMLIEAAKCLREADEGSVGMGPGPSSCNYGILDGKMLKRWDIILKKLRHAGNRERKAK
jgi:hypothetical protein